MLPDLELSLERFTENVPADGAWYLIRAGKELGRFRTRKAAADAWKRELTEAGLETAGASIDAQGPWSFASPRNAGRATAEA